MSSAYLVQPLEKLPPSELMGIHQSDIIIRTAIIAGLADLRANPQLLEYVFASLPRDPLTYREYGEHEIQSAKDWFMSQEIPVYLNTRMEDSRPPCITIAVQSSTESASTLGDVHYQPSITGNTRITTYYGPFTPKSYNPATGIMSLRSNTDWEILDNMKIQDHSGATHDIEEIIDPWTLRLAKNLTVDFTNAKVVASSADIITLESLEFREEYEIAAHAPDPLYLTYLHSILVFVLLRYKEALIESRGLERTTIQSGTVMYNTEFKQPTLTRMVRMTGFVHHSWPKFITPPVEGVVPSFTFARTDSDQNAVEIDTE